MQRDISGPSRLSVTGLDPRASAPTETAWFPTVAGSPANSALQYGVQSMRNPTAALES